MNIKKYKYFPALRIRVNEMKGLENLDSARKNKIIPLLSLGRWSPKGKDFERAAEIADQAMNGGLHFLDITDDPRHLPDQQKRLRSPKDGFGNWRAFLSDFPNALPIVQITDKSDRRHFIQQTLKLENEKRLIGFRIKDPLREVDLVINALSAMSNPENAVVYIDSRYIRSQVDAYASANIDAALSIRQQIENANIVTLSTSFPRSIIPFADITEQRGSIDIQEIDLYSRVTAKVPVLYGDHGSIHSKVYDDQVRGSWSARIDYPKNANWEFEWRRGQKTEEAYVEAATEVVRRNKAIGKSKIWGEEKITDTASGHVYGRAPGPWIAVRVNIHLSRQIDQRSRLKPSEDDEEFADYDE